MKVLIACEFSGIVRDAFLENGHDAMSCDLLPTESKGPHYQGDMFDLDLESYDLIIAHPPCTYLTVSGNRWFDVEKYGQKAIERAALREDAIVFFKKIASINVEKIAIENPIGTINSRYRKPDQIVHPYHFGDPHRKATCFWLKNLPKLNYTNVVEPEIIHYKNGKGTDSRWHIETFNLPKKERSKVRSKTFPGIAKAMAEQWGDYEL